MKALWLCCLLAGALITPAWSTDRFPVEVVHQPHQRWQFKQLNAFKNANPTRLSGRLTAHLTGGLPQGHIDVAAYSSDGKLIAATTTGYVPAVLTHTLQKKGGVYFSTEFKEPFLQM